MKINIKKLIINKKASLKQALKVIDKGALGIVLVVDDNKKYCGLMTDGDVRRAFLAGHNNRTIIEKVMQKNSVTVKEGASKEDILRLMSSRIRHIPVLNSNNQIIDLALYSHFYHVPMTEPVLQDKELEYVTNCILSNWISSSGEYVVQFERNFSKFCGARYGVATSNGTTALHLALVVLGVGKGDEVIVPSLSFIATANAVTYTGARPVFVDVESDTWCIDPDKVRKAITKKTKAIIPVHLYGHPADMGPLLKIADKQKIYVIEDAAEAHGAFYKNNMVGSLGDIGCFSFFGNKIITTGEGGMLVTDNQEFAERAKILRDHGMSRERKYWHPYIGFNYRLTNIQAAIGVAQLERIEDIIEKKRKNAAIYNASLRGVRGIEIPPEKDWARNIYWMYSILVDKDYGLTRDQLMQRLSEYGIDTRPLFYPIHKMPPYATSKILPVTEDLSSRGLSLPSGTNLSENEIKRIAGVIKKSTA